MHRFARFYVVLVMANCHAFFYNTGSHDRVKSRKHAAHHHLQSHSLLSLHNKPTKTAHMLVGVDLDQGRGGKGTGEPKEEPSNQVVVV